ncbi:MAG: Fic family protein [Rubrimonas sp.]|uniref:Fic family protein n=1 Tax=Rubrimonas sp. TaxID=2036015 RepID=UPI002FDEBF0F
MVDDRRHSTPEKVLVAEDTDEKARLEAANALRQAERVQSIIYSTVDGSRPFKLRPSLLLDLNRVAISGIDQFAGNFRPCSVSISKSKHIPPGAHQVPELVEEMCDYVNDNWQTKSAIHLSAFVMWRLNWIHPFTDGNGRTSRAASYVVLCVKEQLFLPGVKTIPEQILENRKPYYDAIEAADERYKESGFSDDIVKEMEGLISAFLAEQLANLHKSAGQAT